MGWKKMLVGEAMPDKEDPKYRQRYESDVKAGRKFAKTLKLDVMAGRVQHFANGHKKMFLVLVFGFIIISFALNIYRMAVVYQRQHSTESATQRQEQLIRQRHRKVKQAMDGAHNLQSHQHRENQQNNNVKTENDGRIEKD